MKRQHHEIQNQSNDSIHKRRKIESSQNIFKANKLIAFIKNFESFEIYSLKKSCSQLILLPLTKTFTFINFDKLNIFHFKKLKCYIGLLPICYWNFTNLQHLTHSDLAFLTFIEIFEILKNIQFLKIDLIYDVKDNDLSERLRIAVQERGLIQIRINSISGYESIIFKAFSNHKTIQEFGFNISIYRFVYSQPYLEMLKSLPSLNKLTFSLLWGNTQIEEYCEFVNNSNITEIILNCQSRLPTTGALQTIYSTLNTQKLKYIWVLNCTVPIFKLDTLETYPNFNFLHLNNFEHLLLECELNSENLSLFKQWKTIPPLHISVTDNSETIFQNLLNHPNWSYFSINDFFVQYPKNFSKAKCQIQIRISNSKANESLILKNISSSSYVLTKTLFLELQYRPQNDKYFSKILNESLHALKNLKRLGLFSNRNLRCQNALFLLLKKNPHIKQICLNFKSENFSEEKFAEYLGRNFDFVKINAEFLRNKFFARLMIGMTQNTNFFSLKLTSFRVTISPQSLCDYFSGPRNIQIMILKLDFSRDGEIWKKIIENKKKQKQLHKFFIK